MREGFENQKDVAGDHTAPAPGNDVSGATASNEDQRPAEPLAEKFLGGAGWLFGSYALSKVGRIVMMLAVAALLSPKDYGLIGLTSVIFTVAQIMNEFGIWQAVVNRSDPDESFLNTAFFANVLVGFLNGAVIFIVAPWIAEFYGEPMIATLFRVMAISLIIDSLAYVPGGLLRKELKFKSLAFPEIAGAIGAGIATISLILLGLGVVSYAVGFVVESVIRSVLILLKSTWRPSLHFSRTHMRKIGAYARYILGADLARHISSNIDYLIVGRVLGAGPLGFYTLAFNLANYPVSNFAYVLSKIAFPAFAALQEDPDYAKRVYLRMVQIVAAVVVPVLVLFALLADSLLVGVLGEKWQPAVFITQVMVVAGISRAISMPGFDMLRAIGFPSTPFKINLLEGLTMLAALFVLANRGIEVVAMIVTTIMSLSSWTITLATCRAFGIKLRSLGRALLPGMILATSGAVPILLLKYLDVNSLSGVSELAVMVTLAGVAMTICLATVLRSLSREILGIVLSRKLD
jgi:O-antigen/teichoic acid export membrane protein